MLSLIQSKIEYGVALTLDEVMFMYEYGATIIEAVEAITHPEVDHETKVLDVPVPTR